MHKALLDSASSAQTHHTKRAFSTNKFPFQNGLGTERHRGTWRAYKPDGYCRAQDCSQFARP